MKFKLGCNDESRFRFSVLCFLCAWGDSGLLDNDGLVSVEGQQATPPQSSQFSKQIHKQVTSETEFSKVRRD